MVADNQQGRTQERRLYRLEYNIIGAEDGGSGSKTFIASSDAEARTRSDELIQKAQDRCNQNITNRFWHYRYEKTAVYRIEKQEVSQKIE